MPIEGFTTKNIYYKLGVDDLCRQLFIVNEQENYRLVK